MGERTLIWIPNETQKMKFKMLFGALYRNRGHRGIDAIELKREEQFWWDDLKLDVINLFNPVCIA